MSTNRRYANGSNLSVTCTHPATPSSGQPVRVGNLIGVAITSERADGTTSVDFGPAVYSLSVKGVNDSGNVAVAAGDPLYYVDADVGTGTGFLSKKDTGRFAGTALGAVTTGSTTAIDVLLNSGQGIGQAELPSGFVRVSLVTGGAAGNLTLTGIAVGDEISFVGMFATAASIATLTDITSEFTVSGTNTINNTGGTATTNNQLMVVWIDRT